jgi:hypothetical protein
MTQGKRSGGPKKESESAKIEHLKALGIKARADFRKQLQAYERLKKNQHTFSPLLTQLAVEPATSPNTAACGDTSATATAKKAAKGASKTPQEVRGAAVAIKLKKAKEAKETKEAKEDQEVKQSREGKPPATGAAPVSAAIPASDLPSPPSDRPAAMGSAPITGAHNSSSDHTSRL